jgi:hypothetical protein
LAGLPPSEETTQETEDGKRCLHREPPLVRGLPLGEEGAVVQQETRWLLRDVDENGRPCEKRRDQKSKVACEHAAHQRHWEIL